MRRKANLYRHDIVVIGASAGGVQALIDLVKGLPKGFPAAVFIVLHIPVDARSELPNILNRAGKIPVSHAVSGEDISSGHIYIAPPDRHLLLDNGKVLLSTGPREHGLRPAIDPLFRSAALTYQDRVIGVVLSGTRSDGTSGLIAVKSAGGITIVQDPRDAIFPDMPLSAIHNDNVDYVLPVVEIAEKLGALTGTNSNALKGGRLISQDPEGEKIVREGMDAFEFGLEDSELSFMICPECGGALWKFLEFEQARYRCHVGHVFSPESLVYLQGRAIEKALWVAVRTLEERASLSMKLAKQAEKKNRSKTQAIFESRYSEAQESAHMIRQLLLNSHLFDSPLSESQEKELESKDGFPDAAAQP